MSKYLTVVNQADCELCSILLPRPIYPHRGQAGIKICGLLGCHTGMWWLRGCGLPALACCLLRISSSPGSPSLHIPAPSLQTATLWLLLRGVTTGGVACPWEIWPGEGPGSGLETRQGILGSLVPKAWSGKGGVGSRWACLHGMEHSQWRTRSARPRGPC